MSSKWTMLKNITFSMASRWHSFGMSCNDFAAEKENNMSDDDVVVKYGIITP